MKSRRIIAIATIAATLGISSGLFSLPAAADTSTAVTVVFDAANNLAWGGTEVTGASAYDTTIVTGDGTQPPTGAVTYSFFDNGSCTSDANTTTDTVTLAGDGSVPNSAAQGPLGAGDYSFNATYSGDANNDPSDASSCEPFTVAKTTPSTATTVFDATTNAAWGNSEATGASAYDTSAVTGVGGFTPTGSVTYSFFDNGSCTSDANTTTQSVTLVDGSVPNSTTLGPLGAGSYSFHAIYLGDTNYNASAASSCEPFTVGKATPSIATTVFDATTNAAWGNSEATGASAYDTSAVTGVGGFTPTGSVSYSFFDNGSCTSDANTTTQSVTLVGGSVPNSAPQGPLGAGDYSFKATYSGDANNDPSDASSCEPFTVAKTTPSTATTVFDATTNAAWTGGHTGASAYDTSAVTGVGGFTPTGSVTYSFFDNGSCTSDANTTTQSVTLVGGSVPNSSATGALGAGSYSFHAIYLGDTNYNASAASSCEPFTVGKATPSTATTVFDATTNAAWGNSEATGASAYDTSAVTGVGGFTPTGSVTYSFFDNGSCTSDANTTTQSVTLVDGSVPNSTTQGPLGAGSYSFHAIYLGDTNYNASAASSCEPFTVGKATPSIATTVFDASTNAAWTSTETTNASAYDSGTVVGVTGFAPTGTVAYTYFQNGTCSGSGTAAGSGLIAGNGSIPHSITEGPLAPGSYSFGAAYSLGDGNYSGSTSSCEQFTVAQGTPTAPTITPPSTSPIFGGTFLPVVTTNGDGATSVTSSTPGVCTLSGSTVVFNGVGTCILTAHVAGTVNFGHRDGSPQFFTVVRATPSSPNVANFPAGATEFTSFVATVATNGDGAGSLASATSGVCTVAPDGITVTFVGFGACTLTANVGQGAHYLAASGSPQTFNVNPAARGYWLVGSDGGIFSFGAAGFHGSMGGIPLQRPVVGITPTASRHGYWLVASDGGIFSFGDSSFYGSIPGVGLHPAGSGQPNSLNAPIVGMVPSTSGHGYFMVASDGGVFAFGDARFAGSCPGIGGCYGAAVAVMPDSTGNGYWLVTNLGAVYAFGDAGNYGEPPAESVPAVDAVATPDGRGYWVLYANGVVFPFGDAGAMGFPLGYVNSFNPASAIFPTADGHGYWVAAARGDVFSYGDAPYMGSMAAAGLNGQIIAGFGF